MNGFTNVLQRAELSDGWAGFRSLIASHLICNQHCPDQFERQLPHVQPGGDEEIFWDYCPEKHNQNQGWVIYERQINPS